MILRAIGYVLKAAFYLWLAAAVYGVASLGYQHAGWMGAIGAVLLAGGLVALAVAILVMVLVTGIGLSITEQVESVMEAGEIDTPWLDAERNHAAAEGIELMWWKSEE